LSILQAGAGGYLTKTVYDDEVVNAVRSLVSGETVLSPAVSQQILKYAFHHITKPIDLGMSNELTNRELETLILAAKGISNRDIAYLLNIGIRTVKSHLATIFLKLGVASRTEAVITGLKKGILTLDDLE
jgi:DNA-binding NarL/FixJ family response regulator